MTLSLIHILHSINISLYEESNVEIDLPTREDSRCSQTSANRSVGYHEHLRLLTVFRQISLLYSNGSQNDKTKQDRKSNDDAIAMGLIEEDFSHRGNVLSILWEYLGERSPVIHLTCVLDRE